MWRVLEIIADRVQAGAELRALLPDDRLRVTGCQEAVSALRFDLRGRVESLLAGNVLNDLKPDRRSDSLKGPESRQDFTIRNAQAYQQLITVGGDNDLVALVQDLGKIGQRHCLEVVVEGHGRDAHEVDLHAPAFRELGERAGKRGHGSVIQHEKFRLRGNAEPVLDPCRHQEGFIPSHREEGNRALRSWRGPKFNPKFRHV